MEWGMYHGCKLVSMGNSPFLKRGRGFSEYILYWPGLWVVPGTHFQLSGCEWLTNLLCQMTKWPWSTCSCHNRDYFVIFPQQMEWVWTKGGFFPPIPTPRLSLDIHMLYFLQLLSALNPVLQPKPFFCVFTEFDQTPQSIGDTMAKQSQSVICESVAETLFAFAFGSQKIKVIKLLWVLFCFHEQNTEKLNCQKDSGSGVWEKVLLPIQTWAGMLRREMQCWD